MSRKTTPIQKARKEQKTGFMKKPDPNAPLTKTALKKAKQQSRPLREVTIQKLRTLAQAEQESMAHVFVPSVELIEALMKCGPAQARAIPRLAEARVLGLPIMWLFDKMNPDRIGTRPQYTAHWKRDPRFVYAEGLYEKEMRAYQASVLVTKTVLRLQEIAPQATEDLQRQIVGDRQAIGVLQEIAAQTRYGEEERIAAIKGLASIGTRESTEALLTIQRGLTTKSSPRIRLAVVRGIGVSASATNNVRRQADTAVLNHAAKELANKGPGVVEPPPALMDGLTEEQRALQIAEERWAKVGPLLGTMIQDQASRNGDGDGDGEAKT